MLTTSNGHACRGALCINGRILDSHCDARHGFPIRTSCNLAYLQRVQIETRDKVGFRIPADSLR